MYFVIIKIETTFHLFFLQMSVYTGKTEDDIRSCIHVCMWHNAHMLYGHTVFYKGLDICDYEMISISICKGLFKNIIM